MTSPYLDYIKTHVDDMLGASAVVSGSGVAFQGIAKVTTVKVMISKVIMTPPKHVNDVKNNLCKKASATESVKKGNIQSGLTLCFL